MKLRISKQKLLSFFVLGFYFFANSQAANCVHGQGIQFLLDAYLGSFGACSCEKTPINLFSFPSCNNGDFVLEFEDNFDGVQIDTSKWEVQPWGQGTLQGEATNQYYSLDNITLQNGICYITAKKENVQKRAVNWKDDTTILSDGLPNLRNYQYTSSNIWTKKKFFQGKYEIRCKMPQGNGFWPAFWMFGGQRWNEIDVFDSYAGTTNLVSSIGHDYDNRGKSNGCSKKLAGYDLDQWHTFTCIFDFDKMTFLVDNKEVRVIHRILTLNGQPIFCGDDIGQGTYFQLKSYPIERMSIIANLALIANSGEDGFVPIDDSTPFPSSFEVDYIKMWKRSDFEEYALIQPNPTSEKFTVTSNSTIYSVNIYDVNGKLVQKIDSYLPNTQIDLTGQPNGVYFVRVELNSKIHSLKLVKFAP